MADCKLARDALSKLILDLKTSALQTLFRLSRELAALHLLNQDLAGYNRVLAWTTDTLQDMVLVPSRQGYNYENIQCVINHLV